MLNSPPRKGMATARPGEDRSGVACRRPCSPSAASRAEAAPFSMRRVPPRPRIVADGDHDQPGEEQRDDEVQDRDQPDLPPRGKISADARVGRAHGESLRRDPVGGQLRSLMPSVRSTCPPGCAPPVLSSPGVSMPPRARCCRARLVPPPPGPGSPSPSPCAFAIHQTRASTRRSSRRRRRSRRRCVRRTSPRCGRPAAMDLVEFQRDHQDRAPPRRSHRCSSN